MTPGGLIRHFRGLNSYAVVLGGGGYLKAAGSGSLPIPGGDSVGQGMPAVNACWEL